MSALLWPAINFCILIGALVYFLKKPLSDFVTQRHTYLRDEVQKVASQLRSSQGRFQEFSAKLQAIENEVVALRSQAKQDAEAMKVRVLTDAKKQSSGIVADSHVGAAAMTDDLKSQLKSEFGVRVIDRAENIIRSRLTVADRVRIRQDFSRQVETSR